MGDEIAEAKVAPRALYYVVIDGTEAKDSAAFGGMIQGKFGWRNLLNEFLPRVEDQPTGIAGDKDRLIDEAHPYLPIHLHKTNFSNSKIAVVEPGGRDCLGQDPFLREYAGERPEEKPHAKKKWVNDLGMEKETFGRHTAIEKSGRFIHRFILEPAVDVTPGTSPVKARVHDSHPDLIYPWPEHLFHAELLLVSSHGWLGGFMRGNMTDPWANAVPDEAKKAYNPDRVYFSVGEAATHGWGFRGPLWIVLAQCSTLNEATWGLWVKVFAKSEPFVRGVLAYEEASPDAAGSINIFKNFFNHLVQGKSMLQAWKSANTGQKWAAIVHQDAIEDKMQDWRSFEPLKDAQTTPTLSSYRGYLRSVPDGRDITETAPPFRVRLRARLLLPPDDRVKIHEIDAGSLHSAGSAIYGGFIYWVHFIAPTGKRLTGATLEWIHIRDTYHKQFAHDKMWVDVISSSEQPGIGMTFTGFNTRKLSVKLNADPREEIAIEFTARRGRDLEAAGLEPHHSYLWIRASVTLEDGATLSHDFKTIGLGKF
ncbi:MAG: hypothetical protein H6811_04200 [Phycisphaeraceae bacterium]|nr:hypothetical protein [Phycisphaeraceae bacterium]